MRFLILLLAGAHTACAALWQTTYGGKWNGRFIGGELGLDVHEPYVSFSTDIRKRYTPRDLEGGEIGLYRQMLRNAFVPGYVSLETSAYPLLIMSSSLKTHRPGAYNHFSFGESGTNALQILTSEFTDPLAFSLFLGEVMNFRQQVVGKAPQSGYGLMGYVISFGPWSSFNNEFFRDRWWEFKWKIKGLKRFDGMERTWNLMMGYHYHENPLFLNTLVFEVARSFKMREKKISWLRNTEIEAYTAIAPQLELKDLWARQQFGLSLGIFYPVGNKVYLKLNGGFQKELLFTEEEKIVENFKYFITPTITF